MKTIKLFIAASLLVLSLSCSKSENIIEIIVTNPLDNYLEDVFITKLLTVNAPSFTLKNDETEIPYQIIYENNQKLIAFVIDLNPNETRTLQLIPDAEEKEKQFKNRTYAELAMKPGNIHIDGKFRGSRFENVTKIKVPEIHTDHDALFKYEGPGWESEKVGYRFYLDWRNATDIFGKKTNDLILHKVGINDTVAKDDSYHQMQEWGMDIFKVGKSLGIGSIGMWHDNKVNMVSKTDSVYCEITENGPIRSQVKTNYFGWMVGENKYDLESRLSITAGGRLTKTELTIEGSTENLVTGLAKFEGTNFIKSNSENGWAYIALYGNQTLVNENDKLGIAVFYNTSELIELTEDDLSYIVKLNPANNKVEYYFCAAWEQEPNGIKTEEEFVAYLNETLNQLNNPPVVELKK
jgi:hypothetical protein